MSKRKKRKLPFFDRSEMTTMINMAQDHETNDRAIAIVCMAHIEDALAELIRLNLESYNDDMDDSLFSAGGSAPLSTFKNKVVIAEAMGIIYPEFSKDLLRMAKIRNEFAHKLRVDGFDHELVSGHVDQLNSVKEVVYISIAAQFIPSPQSMEPSRRRRFSYSAIVAAMALNGEDSAMIDRVHMFHTLSD